MSKLKLKSINQIINKTNGKVDLREEQERQEKEDYEEGGNAAKIGETCPTSASQKFKEGFKKKEQEIKNSKKNLKMK